MSKVVLCGALGLSGLLAAFAAEGCSSSNGGGPATSPDGGTPYDSGTISDSGNTAADTGTTTTDSGTTTTDSGPVQGADAGPWTPSNFTLAGIANGLTPTPPAIDLTGSCTADTTDGSFSCDNGTTGTLADGGQPTVPFVPISLPGVGGPAIVWVMSSLTLEATQTIHVIGPKAAIFYVQGTAAINGAITVTAGAQTGGIGAGQSPGNSTSFGAGGGGYCGAGGTGAFFDDAGTATVGAGGVTNGSATLIPLLGGAPGGSDSNTTAGGGAAGGGALQITAGTSITITSGGSILAAGFGGGNDDSSTTGAGSGGAILLESPSVAIAGSLSVNGGGGSDTSATGNNGALGTSQAVGGGGGGVGSGGVVINGGNATGTLNATGGGGAGYIRINTSNPSLSATFSPAIGDAGGGCVTVGPL